MVSTDWLRRCAEIVKGAALKKAYADAADEIDALRAALREIENIPQEQFVLQGPRLAASVARRALNHLS